MSPELEAAISYASRDLSVFPCDKKIPLTGPGGFKNASLDASQILEWWTEHPRAQIGLPTGEVNHLFVVDIDGPLGEAAIEKMKLPETFTVETRPGRQQLWFRQPEGITTRCTASVLARQLDTRGDGGYVIAPPSIHHETGQPYRILKNLPWADAPEQLLYPSDENRNGNGAKPTAALHEGSRRPTLFKIACKMRREGLSEIAIYEAIKAIPCDPPLPVAELRKLAHGTLRYDRGGFPDAARMETSAEVETESFSDVPVEPLRWLWEKKIPLGKLTIFAGDPGQGKSLATIDIAARISRGSAFPDDAPAEVGDTLILSCEDDARDTIAPRLLAAGADMSRVHRVKAVRVILTDGEAGESMFNFERDIEKLDAALARIPKVRLLVVDPLSAYMGKIDTHRDAEIRRVLGPLADLAARRRLGVIGIMHLKKNEASALLRVSGSIAFVAAARAVWVFGEDPDATENHVMVPVKSNLAARESGLAYRIEAANSSAPKIVWQKDPVTINANDVVISDPREKNGTRGDRKEAMEWLRAELSDGPLPVPDLENRAKESGLSWRTIRRAKDRLPIDAHKTSVVGGWCWELRTRR